MGSVPELLPIQRRSAPVGVPLPPRIRGEEPGLPKRRSHPGRSRHEPAVIASPTPQPSGARPLPSWERLAAAVIDFVVLLIPQVILATLIAGPQYSRLFAYATAHARESNLAKDPHFVRLADRLTPALLHYG